MEAIWHPSLDLSLRHGYLVHGLGVPHHERGFVGFPVVDKGHEIPVILRLSELWVFLLEEDLAPCFVFSEFYFLH